MITDKDIKKLKKAFATKDDLSAMEKRQNERFATKDDLKAFATKDDLHNSLDPIKKGIRQINRKLNTTIKFFDKLSNYHHRRLNQLEEKVGVKPPPYEIPIN